MLTGVSSVWGGRLIGHGFINLTTQKAPICHLVMRAARGRLRLVSVSHRAISQSVRRWTSPLIRMSVLARQSQGAISSRCVLSHFWMILLVQSILMATQLNH